ncbi:MAG: hypothetical protein RLZZ168_612 [Cyanobacteriota bacterium]|jgi:hypothetical protein|uniref:hypothetical protein n=1 Tax=Vulcanococcus sp. TaxID=2856995 RepID=UPI0035064A57
MSQVLPPPCWSHRGCRIQLLSSGGQGAVYRVRHQSGAALGQVGSLAEARQLIDDQIVLIRQRLAAVA